jgi:hypothetical protein
MPYAHSPNHHTTDGGAATRFLDTWDQGQKLLLCACALLIVGIVAYNGLNPESLLYSLGVVLAAKTRI